ncbi:MAG: malate/lactate/ureidoglycolate dehydrogenase [Kiloniellaceae bacterium]
MAVLVHAEPLRRLVREIFLAAGCAADEAARIAKYLVRANLTGHDSHGVIRVPRYVRWMDEGRLKPGQTITIVTQNDAMAVIEGNAGFGQTIGPQAVRLGIEKARRFGVSVIALRHSGHLGRIGDWAEMAVEAGLVSIHLVNVSGSLLVAPFGAVQRRMATNPLAIGVPRPDAPPLILDFATSVVAEGKILVAFDGGKPLPEGSLIGDDGRLSDDPAVFYGPRREGRPPDPRFGSGAIRAMGEHKGSGLSFMIELLAGALTGSGCAGPGERPLVNGMLSLYLAPEVFDADNGFAAEIRRYVDFFKSAKAAAPDGEVLVPGEPERRTREARLARGIPLPEDTWQEILGSARKVGLRRDRIDAALAGAPGAQTGD